MARWIASCLLAFVRRRFVVLSSSMASRSTIPASRDLLLPALLLDRYDAMTMWLVMEVGGGLTSWLGRPGSIPAWPCLPRFNVLSYKCKA